ncbi:MAG: Lrp/AsnC ligand binding domain-containing protein [Ignavibacteriales bacterium]|nr:Lrp/AsnC ligand binding domain-containing protein [Ignavibacteriales bacterium]
MVSAVVLLTVERDKINHIAEKLADMHGVSEVYSVAGRYDLVAVIRVQTNDDLSSVVTEHIRSLEGITSSETLISFRVFSRHDLDRVFSIGMEKK